ncbi:MAG TPA: hypothetical protein VHM91_14720 [Verrucomicrobiales bacterium]|jgi:hypothetical protein|nr:hypothetical protein [Verrucomicrobiales bacterium]
MSPRLISAIIFLFCGTMTALLVRSVLFPENSGLADVAPNVPFDLFVARTEGSSLDIWEANKIIGTCHISPSGVGVAGPKVRKAKVRVKVDVIIQLPREIMGGRLIDISADLWLHADGNIDLLSEEEIANPALEFKLRGSVPEIRLSVSQPPANKPPRLKLVRGGLTLFESSGGLQSGDPNSQIISGLLQAAGVPPESLTAREEPEKSTATVRAGHIEAGGETFDGYVLTTGSDEESRFSLYMSNTGEILRVHTPFSGKNDLGLRLLSETVSPKDTVRSHLDRNLPVLPDPTAP